MGWGNITQVNINVKPLVRIMLLIILYALESSYHNSIETNDLESDAVSRKEMLDDLETVTDWWSFGKALGMAKSELFAIYLDGRTTKKCKCQLIDVWYRLEQPTWLAVVTSLFKSGMASLGWKVAAKHSECERIIYIMNVCRIALIHYFFSHNWNYG